MRSRQYDVAQVCLNGHVINWNYQKFPYRNREYCPDCGAKTITECPNCQAHILGDLFDPGVIAIGDFPPPKFCDACGEPYPWTRAKLEAVMELADEMDDLSDEEREKLKASLPDLIADTPKTEVAAARFKKLIGKVGGPVAAAVEKILVDIASETAKKILYP